MGRLKSTCITLLIMCLLCTCLYVCANGVAVLPMHFIIREGGLRGGTTVCVATPIGMGVCQNTFGEGWMTKAPTTRLIRALNRFPLHMDTHPKPFPDEYSYTVISLIPPRWLRFSDGDARKDERLEEMRWLINEVCERLITPEDIRRFTAPFERR